MTADILILSSLTDGAGYSRVSHLYGMASAKMQLLPLSVAANELQINSRLISVDVNDPSILNELGSPAFCFISKINHYDDDRFHGYAMAVLAATARLKSLGTKLILLYCDNLASLPCARGSLYRDLLRLVDYCVVPSQSMAKLASQFALPSTSVTVIEDPWQVREQPFKELLPSQKLRIAWFGNTSNIFYVRDKLGELMQNITGVIGIELVILSSPKSLEIVERAFQKLLPNALKAWSLELIAWDDSLQPTQLEDVLGSCHVAWIPSNPNDSLKAGVSHNRLVDAVLSGCIPIASEMQSYMELRKLALLGENHGQLINSALPQYQRLIAKYQELRASMLARFSPALNHQRWVSFLRGLQASS